jgi:hypothetical protein
MTEAIADDAGFASRPFTVGGVLGQTIEVFRHGFWRFAVIALIATAPMAASAYYFEIGAKTLPAYAAAGAPLRELADNLIMLVCTLLAQVCIVYGTYRRLHGQGFKIGQSFSAGLKCAGPAFCVMMLTYLQIGLACLLLLVPGLIVLCLTFVAVPACVVERPGIFTSISRSRALTKGYRWQILGLSTITMITLVVGVCASHVVLTGGFSPAARPTVSLLASGFAWGDLYIVFSTVLATVVYHQLRIVKEGMDVEMIAGVFD